MKVVVAMVAFRDYDVGEEDWHLVRVFHEGVGEEKARHELLAALNAEMDLWRTAEPAPGYPPLPGPFTMEQMEDIDGPLVWHLEATDVLG